jgi:hypothetical protein
MNEVESNPDNDGDRVSVQWARGPRAVAIVGVFGNADARAAYVDLEDAKKIHARLGEPIAEREALIAEREAAKIRRGDKVRGMASGRLYVAIADPTPNLFTEDDEVVEVVVLKGLERGPRRRDSHRADPLPHQGV